MLFRSFICIKLSYHYALSHDMAQGALVFHGTSAGTGRPFDGYIYVTDIDCEYTLTFQLHLI